MKYNFDEVVNRKGSWSTKWDVGKYLIDIGIAERFDDNTIPAFTADMDFKCAQPIIDAIKKVADYGVLGYVTIETASEYYEAIINWFNRRYNWDIAREWIVYMNGTVNALRVAIDAFTEVDDGIIIMPPVYFPFFKTINAEKRRVVSCPLKNDGKGYYSMDFELLERQAKRDDVKALILCNPHNPVGRAWTETELKKVSDICAENNILILSDEIHGDLTRKDIRYVPIATVANHTDNIVTFTAVTKSFNLAGLQIANVIIPNQELREKYYSSRGKVAATAFGIAALIAAYNECEEWLDELREYLDDNIDWVLTFLNEYFPDVVCYRPEGTYILWMDFRGTGMSSEEIRNRIYDKANVVLESGKMFDPEKGAGFERICVPMRREQLKEIFNRIKEAFGR